MNGIIVCRTIAMPDLPNYITPHLIYWRTTNTP